MTLFGICPDQEDIVLIVCKECERVVKAEAFLRHYGKLGEVFFPGANATKIKLCQNPFIYLRQEE